MVLIIYSPIYTSEQGQFRVEYPIQIPSTSSIKILNELSDELELLVNENKLVFFRADISIQ
jgi:hypothetical protein